MNLVETALANGQTALSEFQSKQLLKEFGVPVTRESLVNSADEAVAAAEQIGFPVVLKACAWQLMHKSETGCIELGLADADAVRQAYERICEKVEISLEGVLVQEMISGQRELLAGLSRDPQFGPCIMLGFGGVMTEVIKDTVFRVAPFNDIEAVDMIEELKTRAMLDAFRGQAPADLAAASRTLTALGRIGLEEERIAEIDINPLIVSPDGSMTAVDALIILERS